MESDLLPQRLYFTLHNPLPYTVTMELGEPNFLTDEYKKLYDLTELEIVNEAIKHPHILEGLLKLLGIDKNNCWIGANIPKKTLIKNWKHDKPGDVDIIAGSFESDKMTPDLTNLVGIQVKVRKVEWNNDIKKGFPSKNRSADQTYYTALMGFHKTLLLHIFVKDPAPPPPGFTKIWNNAWNRDFYERAWKASHNLIKNKLQPEIFGYAWLGWGQAYRSDFRLIGNILEKIIVPPPHDPFINTREVLSSRSELIKSIKELISCKPIEKYPHIIYF